jgi:sigma-B regulation protein RsbU (phosphoserine phosphatase)
MRNHTGHLLVVDDNKAHRTKVVKHLESQGYTVSTAGDGVEALTIIHEQPFDLVLLGMDIPKVRGDVVLERIKEEVHLNKLPVIIVSSTESSMEHIAHAIHLGADDYIYEPVSLTLLDKRIQACLNKRHSQEEQEQHLAKAERLADLLERVILPMGVALSTETDFERLLERILVEAKTVCNADAGTLYMRTEDDHLRFAIVLTDSLGIALGGTSGNVVNFSLLSLYNKETGEPNHHNVATHVALTGKSINIPDIYEAEGFDFSATKIFDQQNNYRSVSSLTVPLKDNKGQVVGVLQLLNALGDDGHIIPFDDYHRIIVEFMSSQAAIVLNNHLLIQHQQKLYKLENDIQIARTIQSNFLPSKMPEMPGWEISAFFQPARDVAGDFFDVFTMMNNRKLGLMIADVCDKGVGAALFMSLTRSLLRAFVMQTRNVNWADVLFDEPAASREDARLAITANALETAVVSTNNYITEHHLDLNMFATLFFGMLEPNEGILAYINGGHCPPIILSPDGEIKSRLEPQGPAVGMFPGAKFGIEQTQLDHGDMLIAFTDGVTDVRNPAVKLFTEAGLLSLLTPPLGSAEAMVQRITSAVSNHMDDAVQFDDITLLVVRRE